jgi:succinate-semialdehyde dehydrogenase/glutarate-semialdehyde dehydrogenase
MKESGLGRRHGAEGILKFTEAQTVSVQRIPIAPPRGMSWAAFAKWLIRSLKLLRHTRL